MNIAVLGKSRINSILTRQLELEGIAPLVFEDLDDIKSISGEKGTFVIKGSVKSFEAAYIIVTEEPSPNWDNITGQKGAIPLENSTCLDMLPYSNNPVVFIMDYPVDSPSHMTRTALEKAIVLARKKRKVVYLARFMRTAGDALELMYRDARNLGVVFFKYDSISVNYSDVGGTFHITAGDIYDSLDIFTSTPVFTGIAAYSEAFLRIVKLLKLKLDSEGHVNGDSFYLFPSLTNRKGIYFTNINATSGNDSELIKQVQFILSEIKGDLQAKLIPEKYAEVDPEKCAFCYTCYRACPHFAMAPDYENSVMKNLNLSCDGCGICSSVCPANAIAMVGEAGREETPVPGSLKVLCCENSGEIALQRIAVSLREKGIKVDITPVSCGGELSTETIVSALKYTDRVLVAVCMDGACRHFEGNKRARRYVERAKEILRASGLDENRVVYIQLSHAMPMVLDGYIREMA